MPSKKTANSASPALEKTSISINRKRSHRDVSPDASSASNEPSKRVSIGSTAPTKYPRQRTMNTAHLIEERPDWTFDVVGTWEIDATHIERAIDPTKCFREPRHPVTPFTLEIRYDNHLKPGQASRQLWATFQWPSWAGCMRLCPSHLNRVSLNQFYGMCELDEGW